jgi:hypothetical protein
MCHLQLNRCDPRGFKCSSAKAKELQRIESLTKVIRALMRDIYNNSKISNREIYGLTLTDKKICFVYSF